MRPRVIQVSSELPADVTTVWPLLSKVSTLRYISDPYLSFEPMSAEVPRWEQGKVFQYRLELFGRIPVGVHTIEIEAFDVRHYYVLSREHNQLVPVWRHVIQLTPIDEVSCHYTDTVQLEAGALTPVVARWAKAFYRHRQRQWRSLLAAAELG